MESGELRIQVRAIVAVLLVLLHTDAALGDESPPPGYGLQIFLGYLIDYKADSTQSDYVAKKLDSFSIAKTDQDEIIALLLEFDKELEAVIEKGTKRIVCGESTASLSGLDLVSVLNASLDYSDAIYAAYAALVSAEVAARGYADFADQLQRNATGARPYKVRITEGLMSSAELEEMRTSICNRVEDR